MNKFINHADNSNDVHVLAIDIGTKTGWAARLDGDAILSGVENFKSKKGAQEGLRFLMFEAWLELIIQKMSIKKIAYESVVAHRGTLAAHVYGGFKSIIQKVATKHDFQCVGIPVGRIKKHITGNGRADKGLMIQAITAHGFSPQDDNEADALGILLCAIEIENGQ